MSTNRRSIGALLVVLATAIAFATPALAGDAPDTGERASAPTPPVDENSAGVDAIQDEVLPTLVPYAQSLPGYVDGYFDQYHEWRLVLQFETGRSPDRADLLERLPPGVAEPRIETVTHSAAQLHEAMLEAWSLVPKRTHLVGVSVDTINNGLVIEVAPGELDDAARVATEVTERLGMPVVAAEAVPPLEVACTTRENCYSPMKAGTVIRKGSTSGAGCTMGFHVQVGSDEQFVTAGHCSYSGSLYWFHAGYPTADCLGDIGCIGSRTATQYPGSQRDIMRVQMSDSQDSNLIWSTSGSIGPVGAAVDPLLNMWVCQMRGATQSQPWQCGYVTSTSTSWTGTACDCTIIGARSTYLGGIGGDSGSPIVATAGGLYKAVGLLNTTGGHFVRVQDALAAWGVTIRP